MASVRTVQSIASLLCAGALLVAVTGCTRQYHGSNSGIDETLWRQVASFNDRLSTQVHFSGPTDSTTYLDAFEGQRWDGAPSSAGRLQLSAGGIVLYDTSATPSTARVSVFIASGPRVATGDMEAYSGPREVYTCFGIEAQFAVGIRPSVQRDVHRDCPDALVGLLSDGAVFASAEVFDG